MDDTDFSTVSDFLTNQFPMSFSIKSRSFFSSFSLEITAEVLFVVVVVYLLWS